MCTICIHLEGYAAVQKSLLLAESFLGYKGEGNASKVVVFFVPLNVFMKTVLTCRGRGSSLLSSPSSR